MIETKMEKNISSLIKEADWKKEKHVPVIDCPDEIEKDTMADVTISLGKEIAHPNTTEHHIRWIDVYFHPEEEKFPYQIGHYEFNAHGESVDGPNASTIYTHHKITTSFKTSKPGTIYAMALCNIHGLWQSSKNIDLK